LEVLIILIADISSEAINAQKRPLVMFMPGTNLCALGGVCLRDQALLWP